LRRCRLAAARIPRLGSGGWIGRGGGLSRCGFLAGPSGLGDLILSCSSPQSRNFAPGLALGRGEQPNRDKPAEGEFTAPVLIQPPASPDVETPGSNPVAGNLGATSLAAPDDSFTLHANEQRTFHAYGGFTVESAGGAIMIGQYLVSQELVPGGIGDPTFTIFPAADQHRDHYVFLVPATFEDNYMVLALPTTASFELDGNGEFPPSCSERPIGSLAGVTYRQVTCPLGEGVHRVKTSEPAGLTVYGYYSVGSYGYPGGSDVDIINPVD